MGLVLGFEDFVNGLELRIGKICTLWNPEGKATVQTMNSAGRTRLNHLRGRLIELINAITKDDDQLFLTTAIEPIPNAGQRKAMCLQKPDRRHLQKALRPITLAIQRAIQESLRPEATQVSNCHVPRSLSADWKDLLLLRPSIYRCRKRSNIAGELDRICI